MIEIPKDFPWRAGMLMVDVTGSLAPVRCVAANEGVRVYGRAVLFRPARDTEDSPPWPEWAPDLTDPATLGALLGAVREAWRDPAMYVAPSTMMWNDGTPQRWFVYTGIGKGPVGSGSTEAEALLAAWNARPVKA